MSDLEGRFHEDWLGMVQPDGLVVSIPVLVDAQCMQRLEPVVQHRLLELCPRVGAAPAEPARKGKGKKAAEPDAPATAPGVDGARAIADLDALLATLLELTPDLFDRGASIPDDLAYYAQEGGQTIRPTLALRRQDGAAPASEGGSPADDSTPASRAGAPYVLLVWDLGSVSGTSGLDLDRPETTTGPWHYPAAAKFDRLLRHARVPIGLITDRRAVRLVYAPHGESTGSITFRIDDMASVGGRPILDAFVMLLSATRLFGVAPEKQLPALLRESRTRQANVTNELAAQVFDAVQVLLAGFEAAAERDGDGLLKDALAREDDHLYGGLLTVLLRLVFLLYAEDRGLLPTESSLYEEHLSVLGLFDQLQADHGLHPDTMPLRFGAWGRLLAVFRAIYLGVEHGDLRLPARRGELFDPHRYPFLEGWGPGGSAPINSPEQQAEVKVPTVDDGAVHGVLERLLVFQGQRLSYRALDVEQIGSVYEALMGHHVRRVLSPAVLLRPNRVWVTAREVLDQAKGQRAKWLQEEAGLAKGPAEKLAKAITEAAGAKDDDEDAVVAVLEAHAVKGVARVAAGRLVIQPGAERRRTSSHYTPRSLSAPIVRRTIEPLLAAMKPLPTSRAILDLKICDPAMGSGAFLVEACRFVADQLVAAWTREGQLTRITREQEDVVHHARRLIAQRCLYGVDKNPYAVNLAKLSLWLATLAKDLPFTFVDHALRHGDSLVGLSLDQVRAFDWAPSDQLELFTQEIEESLQEAVNLRQWILALAEKTSPEAQSEREHFLHQATDQLSKARLVADVCVGAFFAKTKDKERRAERERRLNLVASYLGNDESVTAELEQMQRELREHVPAFHWMLEFPEIFYADRPDPLDGGRVNHLAWMDAFLGNPPFAGVSRISATLGDAYRDWLFAVHPGAKGKCDLVAHFFRRAHGLIGVNGTFGMIATKTIAEGDTRESGLRPLLQLPDTRIYEAISSLPWPGEAGVTVAIVYIAVGKAGSGITPRLDGKVVKSIDSRLQQRPERSDPQTLASNSGIAFNGIKIYGSGFVLAPSERDRLVQLDPRNASRIFPYVGGDEINSDPVHSHCRYVINFGDMSLVSAGEWPLLLQHVTETVKPERDALRDNADGLMLKQYWWRFFRLKKELYAALAPLPRCLALSRHTKHLVFAFLPPTPVFSEATNVLALERSAHFAVLQSRMHEFWARLLSSSLEERLRYSVEDCFETFPFPTPDPRALPASLDPPGQALYDARAHFMVDTDQGLTKTYNALKDPTNTDPRVVELRRLHEALDRAVLDAYGWTDIAVPPYGTPTTDAERRALEAFEDEVLDRLFQLNAERAAAEQAATPAGKKKTTKATKASKASTADAPDAPNDAAPAVKKKATRKKNSPKPDDGPELYA